MKDLLILAADKNQQHALQGLLQRPEALEIRSVTFEIKVHPQKDPGVRRTADQFLRLLRGTSRRALVLLDHEGSGAEKRMTRTELEAEILANILKSGWAEDSVCVIAIAPELEQWVWSDSPEVERVLGWKNAERAIAFLKRNSFAVSQDGKPEKPKEAVEFILRRTGIPRSSSLYLELAGAVSFRRCSDPAFQKLKDQLRTWFGPDAS